MFSSHAMKQKISSHKCMTFVQQVYIVITNNLHGIMFSDLNVHSSDTFPFLKGGRVNFDNLHQRREGGGGIWKIEKRGWKYGAGGAGGHFSYFSFSRFIIFAFKNYFTLCKIVSCIWRKCHHNFMKKVILSCLKMNLKISHKLR